MSSSKLKWKGNPSRCRLKAFDPEGIGYSPIFRIDFFDNTSKGESGERFAPTFITFSFFHSLRFDRVLIPCVKSKTLKMLLKGAGKPCRGAGLSSLPSVASRLRDVLSHRFPRFYDLFPFIGKGPGDGWPQSVHQNRFNKVLEVRSESPAHRSFILPW
jgi:hypothetical protein